MNLHQFISLISAKELLASPALGKAVPSKNDVFLKIGCAFVGVGVIGLLASIYVQEKRRRSSYLRYSYSRSDIVANQCITWVPIIVNQILAARQKDPFPFILVQCSSLIWYFSCWQKIGELKVLALALTLLSVKFQGPQ